MKKAELYLVGITIVALILKIFRIPGNSILLILSLSALSSMYFYFGILLFNGIRLREIFKKDSYLNLSKKRLIGSLVLGISLSILVIGILFKIELWPRANNMLLPGLFLLVIILITLFYFNGKNKSPFGTRVHKRIIVVATSSVLFYLIPSDLLIDLYHRNNPEIIMLIKESNRNPGDKEIEMKLQDAFEKQRKQN